MGYMLTNFSKSNPGWDYKNSVSNGALFQISARLAQITGEQMYVDWCTKIWDWMSGVGLIDDRYNVFDGTTPSENCSEVNRVAWSYNPSMLLYGTAVLYKHTNGDELWAKRTTGLLTACSTSFFSPYPNATNMYVNVFQALTVTETNSISACTSSRANHTALAITISTLSKLTSHDGWRNPLSSHHRLRIL